MPWGPNIQLHVQSHTCNQRFDCNPHIWNTTLSLQVALLCQKNECLTTLTLLTIFHHLITTISNWSQGSILSMFTKISLHLALMNIRAFAKSQFGCFTLLDSRVYIESDCDVTTSFVTLICLWGLSRPQPLTHGTCTNGIGGAPTSVIAQMHLMLLLWLTNYFMHMLKGLQNQRGNQPKKTWRDEVNGFGNIVDHKRIHCNHIHCCWPL